MNEYERRGRLAKASDAIAEMPFHPNSNNEYTQLWINNAYRHAAMILNALEPLKGAE